MKLTVTEGVHHGTVGLLILLNTICVKYVLVALSMPEMRYLSGKAVWDYYQNYRGSILFFASLILMINILFAVLFRKISVRIDRYIIGILVFMGVVGISYMASPYRETADEGFMETFEWVSVLLSYGILALTTALMPIRKSVLRYYKLLFSLSLIIVTLTSLLQFWGHDPLAWQVTKFLSASSFSPTGAPDGGYGRVAHGFFSNPNYLSSYFSLFLPGVYIAFFRSGQYIGKAAGSIGAYLIHMAVLASGSVSGILLIVSGTILTKWVVKPQLSFPETLIWHGSVLIPFTYFIGMNNFQGFGREVAVFAGIYIVAEISRLFFAQRIKVGRYALVIFLGIVTILFAYIKFPTPVNPELTRFQNNMGSIELTVKEIDYSLFQSEGDFFAKNVSHNQIYRMIPGKVLTDIPFSIERQKLRKREFYLLRPYNIRFEVENDAIYYLNSAYKRDRVMNPDRWGPQGYGDIGNARLYLWQYTLPVIAANPIIGTGPDTFGLVFPQNDVVNKIRYIHNPYALATKAHNVYLNYAVNIGLLGLAVYVAVHAMIIRDLHKIRVNEYYNEIAAALSIGLLLYSIMGIANDSRIFLAVYQWLLLGLAISILANLKDAEESSSQ